MQPLVLFYCLFFIWSSFYGFFVKWKFLCSWFWLIWWFICGFINELWLNFAVMWSWVAIIKAVCLGSYGLIFFFIWFWSDSSICYSNFWSSWFNYFPGFKVGYILLCTYNQNFFFFNPFLIGFWIWRVIFCSLYKRKFAV